MAAQPPPLDPGDADDRRHLVAALARKLDLPAGVMPTSELSSELVALLQVIEGPLPPALDWRRRLTELLTDVPCPWCGRGGCELACGP